jgi:hypothetical protein
MNTQINPQQIINEFRAKNPNGLIANGLDEAVIGMTLEGSPKLIYSIEKCIEVSMKDNDWDYETALEFLEFNTFCAYVGVYTPLFVSEEEIEKL